MDRTPNLHELHEEVVTGAWRPGTSVRFIVEHPKRRDVWAAPFRDRIVHWIWHNRLAGRFLRTFIYDTYACIPGRGTLFGAERAEGQVLSITQGWTRPSFYMKCDLKNFFNSIDKRLLLELLLKRIPEPWWRDLTAKIILHEPAKDYRFHGDPARVALVPSYKRLTDQPEGFGLPIGNLPSQEGANVFLNELDQFVKHVLKARHYGRYVDDFFLLHDSPQQLNDWRLQIEEFLRQRLHLELNPSKTIIQPLHRGMDFVGQVITPQGRRPRRRTAHAALRNVAEAPEADVLQMANSYFGFLGQAPKSHHDRARLAKVVLSRGHMVNGSFTKAYRRAA